MYMQEQPAAVLLRLETLLPGLAAYAEGRARHAHSMRVALWNRVHPDEASPFKLWSRESACLDVDYIIEHATTIGAKIEKRRIEAEPEEGDLGNLLAPLLPGAVNPNEDVLFVSHEQACSRMPSAGLQQFIEERVVLSGDEILAGTTTARIIVLHHEGWLFVLQC